MSIWKKKPDRKKDHPKIPAPNSLEMAARMAQQTEPGPAELARKEIRDGEERRYCSYWDRDVILIPDMVSPQIITCEWSLKDHAQKNLCYQSCIHNWVNQSAIFQQVQENKLSPQEISAIHTYLGVKDYALKK